MADWLVVEKSVPMILAQHFHFKFDVGHPRGYVIGSFELNAVEIWHRGRVRLFKVHRGG